MNGILLSNKSEIIYVTYYFTLKAQFNWDQPLLVTTCGWYFTLESMGCPLYF